MALNGIAPLLVFEFIYSPPVFSGIGPAERPNPALQWLQTNLGAIPIPIVLSEKITGLYVDSESTNIDIETDIRPRYDKDPVTGLTRPPDMNQRGVSSVVNINLLASKDAILLSVLIALADQILAKTVSQEYKLSYFNGPIAIFRGLLHGFSTQVDSNDDLIRITLQIQKPAPNAAAQVASAAVLPRVVGGLP